MTNTIWIVPIEPIDQRYTKQWYTDIPEMLAMRISKEGLNLKIRNIPGQEVEDRTTPGAFLDFGKTNFYKGTQTALIAEAFSTGTVTSGDKFLVTDAWNFTVTAIRYMSELFDIPVEIHGIWHAGAYDPSDILGMKMSPEWSSNQERAWYYACDYNYFATDFHMRMFLQNLEIPRKDDGRAYRSGQPYNYVAEVCENLYDFPEKEDVIVFTHRLNSDKQPDIFRDLVERLPDDWGYVITQDHNYTKEEYYEVLARSKLSFSCSLHENLGIGMAESTLCGCVPIMPGRACYPEIYLKDFIYPTEWTENWDCYVQNRDKLIDFVVAAMNKHTEYHSGILKKQVRTLREDFLDADIMIRKLLR